MNLTRMFRRIFGGNPAAPPASIPVAAPSVGEHVIRRLPKLTTPALDRLSNFFMPTFWGTSNPEAVTEAAKKLVGLSASGHHFADNFLTWGRNMSMLDDRPFVQAWQANIESLYRRWHQDRRRLPGRPSVCENLLGL